MQRHQHVCQPREPQQENHNPGHLCTLMQQTLHPLAQNNPAAREQGKQSHDNLLPALCGILLPTLGLILPC